MQFASCAPRQEMPLAQCLSVRFDNDELTNFFAAFAPLADAESLLDACYEAMPAREISAHEVAADLLR